MDPNRTIFEELCRDIQQGRVSVMAKTESPKTTSLKAADSKKGFSNKVVRWTSISIVSAIMTLGAWAFASPIGSTPDDDYHLVSIWCGQGFRDGICEEGSEPREVVVRETLMEYPFCYAFNPDDTATCKQTEVFAPTTRSNGGENPRIFCNLHPFFQFDTYSPWLRCCNFCPA